MILVISHKCYISVSTKILGYKLQCIHLYLFKDLSVLINPKVSRGQRFQGWLIWQRSDVRVLSCLLWDPSVFHLRTKSPYPTRPHCMAVSKTVNCRGVLWAELCPSPLYGEDLPPGATEDKTFRVVTELK